ncbi:MAG: hypothetical protein Kow00100_15250 [Geothermobacteraceae bacterium]
MKWLFSALLLLLAPAVWASDCVDCHEKASSAMVQMWRQSAHAPAGVGCVDCHGDDHERMKAGQAAVTAEVCGRCHARALTEHRQSRHGLGLHSGWGCTRNLSGRDRGECAFCHQQGSALPVSTVQCARFLKQSSEMGQVGCNRCHQVENACGSCHGNHLTDLAVARDPQVCAKCHMGPDHPQWEMWQTSQHGQLNQVKGGDVAPDCQACHMVDGGHDVSRGITRTPAGKPVAADTAPQRAAMLAVCTSCHAPSFARRELERGDRVLAQSAKILAEAEELIRNLEREGALRPMPEDRPAHPLKGKTVVLDGQMLYEDTSGIEALFFRLKKYAFARTWKGAYHQNPAYSHWYGNAEMKLLLEHIRAEADRLRVRKTAGPAHSGNAAKSPDPVEVELERLRSAFDKGQIDEEQLGRERERVLEKWLQPKHP